MDSAAPGAGDQRRGVFDGGQLMLTRESFKSSAVRAWQQIAVDRVIAERQFVLPETEMAEPGRDVHGRLHSVRRDNRLRPVVCKASGNSGPIERQASVHWASYS